MYRALIFMNINTSVGSNFLLRGLISRGQLFIGHYFPLKVYRIITSLQTMGGGAEGPVATALIKQ
jgi:hypothetical protein